MAFVPLQGQNILAGQRDMDHQENHCELKVSTKLWFYELFERRVVPKCQAGSFQVLIGD